MAKLYIQLYDPDDISTRHLLRINVHQRPSERSTIIGGEPGHGPRDNATPASHQCPSTTVRANDDNWWRTRALTKNPNNCQQYKVYGQKPRHKYKSSRNCVCSLALVPQSTNDIHIKKSRPVSLDLGLGANTP